MPADAPSTVSLNIELPAKMPPVAADAQLDPGASCSPMAGPAPEVGGVEGAPTAVHRLIILSPPEIYALCTKKGADKARYPLLKLLLLSIIAGGYVGLGASTCYLVGGMMSQAPWNPIASEQNYGLFKLVFGAFGFPFAFMAIVVCGSELFTSHCAYSTMAWLEGKITARMVVRVLFVTWVGNFIGCVITALIFGASDTFNKKVSVHERKAVLYSCTGLFLFYLNAVIRPWRRLGTLKVAIACKRHLLLVHT